MSQAGAINSGSGGEGVVEFLVGNSGGPVGPNGSAQINVIGSGGVTVTGDPGTNTLTISTSGEGFTWNLVSGSSLTMEVNSGYFTGNSSLTTLTLPPTSNVGDYLTIIGYGTGGWTIAQAAGQQIRVGASLSTAGTGGSISSFEAHDSIDLVCVVDNTVWLADGAPQSAGLTVV